MEPGFALFLVL